LGLPRPKETDRFSGRKYNFLRIEAIRKREKGDGMGIRTEAELWLPEIGFARSEGLPGSSGQCVSVRDREREKFKELFADRWAGARDECGSSDGEAYEILRQIAQDRSLRGSSGFIKGGYVCVCFAELSLSLARAGFANSAGDTRYTRFGVMVPKDWLFAQGGRPVIYQPDDEFMLLPESHRWRHVTFNLGNDPVDRDTGCSPTKVG